MNYLGQITGWLGMILLLIAYFLISFKSIHPLSRLYQGIFFLGCLAFMISAYLSKNLPISLFNLFLVIMAGWKFIRGKNHQLL